MTIDLFHSSTRIYSPGDQIGPFESSLFSQSQVERDYWWAETLLSDRRPKSQPCDRVNAVFAAGSAVDAAAFLEGQHFMVAPCPDLYCYAVSCANYSKAPMALVGVMEMAKGDATKLEEIVSEYWSPQKEWLFWEYFAPSMTVIGQVRWPAAVDVTIAKDVYARDRAHAKKRWGLSAPPVRLR